MSNKDLGNVATPFDKIFAQNKNVNVAAPKFDRNKSTSAIQKSKTLGAQTKFSHTREGSVSSQSNSGHKGFEQIFKKQNSVVPNKNNFDSISANRTSNLNDTSRSFSSISKEQVFKKQPESVFRSRNNPPEQRQPEHPADRSPADSFDSGMHSAKSKLSEQNSMQQLEEPQFKQETILNSNKNPSLQAVAAPRPGVSAGFPQLPAQTAGSNSDLRKLQPAQPAQTSNDRKSQNPFMKKTAAEDLKT